MGLFSNFYGILQMFVLKSNPREMFLSLFYVREIESNLKECPSKNFLH